MIFSTWIYDSYDGYIEGSIIVYQVTYGLLGCSYVFLKLYDVCDKVK